MSLRLVQSHIMGLLEAHCNFQRMQSSSTEINLRFKLLWGNRIPVLFSLLHCQILLMLNIVLLQHISTIATHIFILYGINEVSESPVHP